MAHQADQHIVRRHVKTRIPTLATEVIPRPRLLALLEKTAHTKLLLVQAPAGYGKTSLLQQWSTHLHAAGASVAWFAPDPSDQDPWLFLAYLLQAIEAAGRTVGDPLRAIVDTESAYSWKAAATLLANSFAAATQQCYLFLDDLQHLKHSEASQCLQLLIEGAPPELHFVLSSREDPGIPLGRLRALGHCIEVHAQELRFTSEEIATYLSQNGAVASKEQLITLEQHTEGWIVGLKLLNLAQRWQSQRTLDTPALSGEQREVADFFAEDVLASQSHDMQEFLLRASVLDRFCPQLCDSLPGMSNSRAHIEQCDKDGLFLISLDQTRTWYRYHQLFAEFLRRELNERHPGLADELCVKASDWLEQSGFYTEAFEYALKGRNPLRAAELLDARCDAIWSYERPGTVQRLAERLPAHVQALYPRIMLAISWRAIAQWHVDQARQLVSVSAARLLEMERSGSDPAFVRNLRWRLQHRESQIAQYQYQLESAEKISQHLIEQANSVSDDPYLLASAYLTLQHAQREQFQLNDIHRLIEKARQEMQRTGFTHGFVFHAAMSGPSYFLAGRTNDAIKTLVNGLAIARDIAGVGSQLAAVPALFLSQILYECNDTETASTLLEEHPDHASVGVVDQLLAACITRSRLARLRGDYDTALSILDDALAFAERHGMPSLKSIATTEFVRSLLRLGRPDEAARVARRFGLPRTLEAAASRRRQTVVDSAIALAWCRLAAAQDRLSEALNGARRWRAYVTTAKATYAAVEWNVLLAELLVLSGDSKAAQRTLRQAIVHAAPARFVRTFLDGGEPIALLLGQMTQSDIDLHGQHQSFARELMNSCNHPKAEKSMPGPQTREMAMITGMNTRELEILTLAGAGVLNKQIAEKLGLTEGTVKWYLQQIFDKLGVRDRGRAAARAKQLGLIA